MIRNTAWGMLLLVALCAIGCAPTPAQRNSKRIWDLNFMTKADDVVAPTPVKPIRSTEKVAHLPGTVAIWTHPTDVSRSLIIATDVSRRGGLVVFGLDGKPVQQIAVPLPYGIQVQAAFDFGRRRIDIAAVIERESNRLRIFGINTRKGLLWEITGNTALSEGGDGNGAMALSLMMRDRQTYAIISRKSNFDGAGILSVYSLVAKEGRVNARKVNQMGEFGRRGIVEAMTTDESQGTVMYCDPSLGIRKYPVLSEHPKELGRFAESGWAMRCAALGIFPGRKPGSGYIVAADYEDDLTSLRLFKRRGEIDSPFANRELPTRPTLAGQRASGMAMTPQALPGYPEGMIVIGDEVAKTYDFYSWRDIRTQRGGASRLPLL